MPYDPDVARSWDETPEAEKRAFGYIPPAVYKGVCTSCDPEGDGQLVDHQMINSPNTGNKGVKIFLEILEPEEVTYEVPGGTRTETTKGKIHEHIFWLLGGGAKFAKSQMKDILGRIPTGKELLEGTVQWAGRTVEFGIKDDIRDGRRRSQVSFMNPWTPEEQQSPPPAEKPEGEKPEGEKPRGTPVAF